MDTFLFRQLNNLVGNWLWLDVLAIFFAQYLEYVLISCLLLFLTFDFKRYLPMIVQAFSAAILARFVIVEIIRYFWERPRPFLQTSVNLLLVPTNQPSFPSGHAAFYFALAAIVYFYNKKAAILFLIGSFLIVLARVYVGIHWPSDIIAGILVGVLSAWLVGKFSETFDKAK